MVNRDAHVPEDQAAGLGVCEPYTESDTILSGRSGESEASMNKRARRKGRAERMWKPFKVHLTEKAQYISRNFFYQLAHYALTWTVFPVMYLVLWVRWGFRVHGRRNLRSLRGRSAVTVSNHIHDVDSVMITAPLWPMTPYVVARKHIVEILMIGPFNWLLGAVPLPEDLKNLARFQRAMKDFLMRTHKKLHVFPEGEIAPYSRELRAFGNGAFRIALDSGVPVVPMVFVSPAPGRVELMVGRRIELSDVPGLADESLAMSRKARILNSYTKARMQEMLDEYYGTQNAVG